MAREVAQDLRQDGGQLRLAVRAVQEAALALHVLHERAQLAQDGAVGLCLDVLVKHEADVEQQRVPVVLVVLDAHGIAHNLEALHAD